MEAEIINLKIEEIKIDGGTQIREQIDDRIVEEYAEDMKAGANFPPIVVFLDPEGKYWLSDGFHRLLAAAMADRDEILTEVREGSLRDAILYSCGANATHGLRRTNKDKKNSVLKLLNDAEWYKWSDRKIAKQCGCHHQLVGKLRASLDDHPVKKELDDFANKRKYVTKHGSTSIMNTSNIGGKSPTLELVEGCTVQVKETYGERPGEKGTIAYCPNSNSAMVIFGDGQRILIAKSQLEVVELPQGQEVTGTAKTKDKIDKTLSSSRNKPITSVSQELDRKQEELGLGQSKESVLPQTDRLDEQQHQNPTDIDDRPFANQIELTHEDSEQLTTLVSNIKRTVKFLREEDYRSIGDEIINNKPNGAKQLIKTFAQNKETARLMLEELKESQPDLFNS